MTLKTITGKISIKEVWRPLSINKNVRSTTVYYKEKQLLVHRIIFRKFIGILIQGLVINHIDHNPFNNDVSNLEQISHSANMIHKYLNRPPVLGNYKISFEIASEIRKKYIDEDLSYRDLMRLYNLSKTTISDIINFKIWKTHLEEPLRLTSGCFCVNPEAQPKWADMQEISEFYKNRPKGYVVDHIIPLTNKNVCGLHVIENLQYLTKFDNTSKRNSFDFTHNNTAWKKK